MASKTTPPENNGPGGSYMSVLDLGDVGIGGQYTFTRPLEESEKQAIFGHIVVSMRFFEDRLLEMGIPYAVYVTTSTPGEENDGPTDEPQSSNGPVARTA